MSIDLKPKEEQEEEKIFFDARVPKLHEKTFKENTYRFIDRNRFNLGISISATLQILMILFWQTPKLDFSKAEKPLDDVAFVDNVSIKDPNANDSVANDGEIELTDKKKTDEKEDPRISGAQDLDFAGATPPVDLNPGIEPEYTAEARENGITGIVTLQIVIADSGEVLQVRAVGKPIGGGLEESAVRAYRKKRFAPSILDGKPLTVRVNIPVRFRIQ